MSTPSTSRSAAHRFALDRRAFLGATALGAIATTSATMTATMTAHALPAVPTAPYVGAGSAAAVRPFPLPEVQLGDGMLREKSDRIRAWLESFDERRFLILFNEQAGRSNPDGMAVPGGWEDGGLLSGHWAGHYMTALAQAHTDSSDDRFAKKLDWMVTELAECQKAITARMSAEPGTPEAAEASVGRVQGQFGSALPLNGDTDATYVDLPQEAANQLRSFTVASWVNLETEQPWSRLFDFGHGTDVNMFLTPRAGVEGSPPRFAITTSGAAGEQRIDGRTAVPVGQWVHLAVTVGDGTGVLYVDGSVVGRNTEMTLDASDLKTPGNVWIGRSQYGDPELAATIDEFHIFDRALSEQEVASLTDSEVGSTSGGNVAWYRFDEEGGTTAVDSSANGRDAGIRVQAGDAADWIPTHPGYLGAIPEDAVIRSGPPRFASYGGDRYVNVWAPWYTQHKIVRGLLDAYYLTGNETAREIVEAMTDWAHLALTLGDVDHPDYTGPITRDDLNYMWDTYIAGEYGGANEVYAEVFALTGKEEHLELAKLFDNRESLFDACRDDADILVVPDPQEYGRKRPARLHANQHVPNFVGYLRIFEQTEEQDYLDVARNFYGMVVPHRMFANAGTSANYPGSDNNLEKFQNRGNVGNAVADSGAESCTTYNLAKLAHNLFLHDPQPAYMDFYERALFNHIAGTRADTDDLSDPQLTYFQPLGPGIGKSYGNTGTCCGGTGIESHTKYTEAVFSRAADDSELWVNQYVPATLEWAERDVVVTQETDFPRTANSRLTVGGAGTFALKLRVPHWALRGFSLRVNGQPADVSVAEPGTYLTLSRDWIDGDIVEIDMPFSIRIERAPDRPDTQAIFWGPLLLPILGEHADGFPELSLYRHLRRDGDYGRAAITADGVSEAGDPLFRTGAWLLRPWYVGDTQPHSGYFRRSEPSIIFGSQDSGVPNVVRNDSLPDYDVPVEGVDSPGTDGLTFLDVVWDQAPFPTHGAFMRTISSTAEDFVKRGLLTAREKGKVVSTAAKARGDLDV